MLPFRAAQIIQHMYTSPELAVEELIKECQPGAPLKNSITIPSCYLEKVSSHVIQFVKKVRDVTGWNLKDCKDVFDTGRFAGSIEQYNEIIQWVPNNNNLIK